MCERERGGENEKESEKESERVRESADKLPPKSMNLMNET